MIDEINWTNIEPRTTSADQQFSSASLSIPFIYYPGFELTRALLNHPATSNITIRSLCPNLEETAMRYWEVSIMSDISKDIHELNKRIDDRFDRLHDEFKADIIPIQTNITDMKADLKTIKDMISKSEEKKSRWKPNLAIIVSFITFALLFYQTFLKPVAEK